MSSGKLEGTGSFFESEVCIMYVVGISHKISRELLQTFSMLWGTYLDYVWGMMTSIFLCVNKKYNCRIFGK